MVHGFGIEPAHCVDLVVLDLLAEQADGEELEEGLLTQGLRGGCDLALRLERATGSAGGINAPLQGFGVAVVLWYTAYGEFATESGVKPAKGSLV